jgi:spore germination protein GerM
VTRARRTATLFLVGAGLLALMAWGVDAGLQRLVRIRPAPVPAAPAAAPVQTAHITATLFYGSADGLSLMPVRQEVPLAEGVVAQGSQILRAMLQRVPAPYLPVIPPGTTLRAFYVTNSGDAFVDLSAQVSQGHPGGTHAELLTVYAIVNAVTANIQGVQRVQILIDGKEADSVAGHIDIRRPLQRDASMVRSESPPAVQ